MQILTGDAFEMLQTLPDESVNCCVTSPPYYGLRDYGIDGQLGLESSPLLYVERGVLNHLFPLLEGNSRCQTPAKYDVSYHNVVLFAFS